MKKTTIITTVIALCAFIYSCGGDSGQKTTSAGNNTASSSVGTSEASGDKGIGKFQDIHLSPEIDATLASKGREISDVKCAACHKMTDERLVGPGWAGVTERRKPEWILNFITNVDEMLDKDAEAQAMLEICMVRMPNQNVSDEDAMALLEYMRENDKQ